MWLERPDFIPVCFCSKLSVQFVHIFVICFTVCVSLNPSKLLKFLCQSKVRAQQWSEIALSNLNGVLFVETPCFTTCRPTEFMQILHAGTGVILL
jgi:hypothetical protein